LIVPNSLVEHGKGLLILLKLTNTTPIARQ
jgi:hypothetical protein